MRYPNFKEEKILWDKGFKCVAGLDEAGRGPLAGPVVAAAVIFPAKAESRCGGIILNKEILNKINDSKKMTAVSREEVYKFLTKNPNIKYGVGIVSEKIIDKINIKNAAELAMHKATQKLKVKPNFLLIDGNRINSKKLQATSYKLIVGGDQKVFSISAASIIAKVTRDRLMQKMHKKYPQYGFDKHKGYGTALHIAMLKKYNACPIHRKTFYPVNSI